MSWFWYALPADLQREQSLGCDAGREDLAAEVRWETGRLLVNREERV